MRLGVTTTSLSDPRVSIRALCTEMRVEIRVREAKIGLAKEIAYLARCRGVRYAGKVRRVYALGLPARSPFVTTVKFDSKLEKWPGNAKAPCGLISSKLCAKSGSLEYCRVSASAKSGSVRLSVRSKASSSMGSIDIDNRKSGSCSIASLRPPRM
ncbi:hypothetical protein IQ07DRAFT_312344 [Pyrenochaeta sp. DS3sAY3a]|nr:hypothetical protein IQ07DRAFT_312344 [Pyrenochaeta sp. DS3sAY3a]